MKKLVYFTGIACMLFLGLYLYSCKKDTAVENGTVMNSTMSDPNEEKMNGDGFVVVCNGNCEGSTATCGLVGQLVNGNHIVTCDCSGCTMTVTERENGITKVYTDEDGIWQVKYMRAFQEYMSTNYPGSYSIVKYEIQSDEDNYVETYSFDTGNGIIQTVVVVGDKLGMKDKVTVYDCKGSCGCTEVFNFTTETCTCTCDPCALSVTIMKK